MRTYVLQRAEIDGNCDRLVVHSANDRSVDDIEYLYDWVVGLKTQFFKEFDAAVIKQVCRVMKYERIPANKTGSSCVIDVFLVVISLTAAL